MNVEKSLECLIQLVYKLLQRSRRSSSSAHDDPQRNLQDRRKGRSSPLLLCVGVSLVSLAPAVQVNPICSGLCEGEAKSRVFWINPEGLLEDSAAASSSSPSLPGPSSPALSACSCPQQHPCMSAPSER